MVTRRQVVWATLCGMLLTACTTPRSKEPEAGLTEKVLNTPPSESELPSKPQR